MEKRPTSPTRRNAYDPHKQSLSGGTYDPADSWSRFEGNCLLPFVFFGPIVYAIGYVIWSALRAIITSFL